MSLGSKSCEAQSEEYKVVDSVRLQTIDSDQFNELIDPFSAAPDDFWKKLNEVIQPILDRETMPCMVDRFFKNEAKKPIGQRSKACAISCPCPKCNPYCM